MKHMYSGILFLACAFCTLFSFNVAAKAPFNGSVKKKHILEVCNAVSEWQIENHHSTRHHNLNWTNGALYKGMVEWGFTTDQAKNIDFVTKIGEKNGWKMAPSTYHADDICVAQAFIDLYRKDRDDKKIGPAMARANKVANNPSKAPLQKNHKQGKYQRWSWCDALFMAPPVYAAMYSITNDKVFLNYLNSEFKECVDSLYDKDEKLFYRDNMRIPLREANGAKQFWGRGCGWVFAGLPLVIDNLPVNEPSRKYYIDLFQEMAEAVLRTQDKKGTWHASLLDPESYPMPETSASGFFCYGFAWGIRNGYLDAKKYKKATEKAWKNLVSNVDKDGRLGYVQPVGADPRQVSKESTDVYGVGAFLLAGSEMYKMSKK